MAAVKNDHQITIRIRTLRGPMTSPRNPPGISNAAYDQLKIRNTQPSCLELKSSSR